MNIKDIAKNILMGLGALFLVLLVIAIIQPGPVSKDMNKQIPAEVPKTITPVSTPRPTPTAIPTITTVETPTPLQPVILSGRGQKATDLFYLPQGLARFEMTHSGDSNFAIWLMNDLGIREGLLVNEIGSFQGSKAVRIEKPGMYLMDITADGTWKVTIT